MKLLFLTVALLITQLLYAQVPAAALQQDLALKYLVATPSAASAHPPVVILLHGYGSNEADLFDLKNIFPADYLVVSAQAPIRISDNGYQWYKMVQLNGQRDGDAADIRNSLAKIKELIGQLVKKYHADPARVYLIGFSQGSIMSLEAGLTAPGMLKGIGVLSGRLLPSLKKTAASSAELKRLKIFMGHGTADQVLPYNDALAAKAFLNTLGLQPVFKTYTGMGHQISNEELKDLSEWIRQ